MIARWSTARDHNASFSNLAPIRRHSLSQPTDRSTALRRIYSARVDATGSIRVVFPDSVIEGSVHIKLSTPPNRNKDKAAAIKQYKDKYNRDPPPKHEWHHADNKGRMELIPEDIHSAIYHKGPVSDRR